MKNTIKTLVKQGQFFSLVAVKGAEECNKKLRKGASFTNRVTRTDVYTNARVCDYEHLGEVKEKREQGIEAVKPTWWHWVEFPFFAEHNTSGQQYLVLKKADLHTQYHLDGEDITKADYPQEFKKSSSSESIVYMVKVEEIVAISASGVSIDTRKQYEEVL